MPRRRSDANLGRVFVEDLRRTHLQRDYGRELKDLYNFYLDDESRDRLASMGRIRRAFSILYWLLKSLLMKLAPARRLLLLAALVLMVVGDLSLEFASRVYQADMRLWGCLLVLIVLALELKDKLVARDEIQIAREVQLALLPSVMPTIPGWQVWSTSRPANHVGGDLVDYVELGGFRHGVVLGDVAGKGLGAALLTAKLQATLRALVPEAATLVDLGSQLNTIFVHDGLDNRFATLFYAELEHDSGQCRYLNAGHNPAFLIRESGITPLGASSLPLGMLPVASYEEVPLELAPGDLLLAYSDGLTEAENADGEEFGADRLMAMLPELRGLPPLVVGERILERVDRFLGEARPGDDLSVVAIVRSAAPR